MLYTGMQIGNLSSLCHTNKYCYMIWLFRVNIFAHMPRLFHVNQCSGTWINGLNACSSAGLQIFMTKRNSSQVLDATALPIVQLLWMWMNIKWFLPLQEFFWNLSWQGSKDACIILKAITFKSTFNIHFMTSIWKNWTNKTLTNLKKITSHTLNIILSRCAPRKNKINLKKSL